MRRFCLSKRHPSFFGGVSYEAISVGGNEGNQQSFSLPVLEFISTDKDRNEPLLRNHPSLRNRLASVVVADLTLPLLCPVESSERTSRHVADEYIPVWALGVNEFDRQVFIHKNSFVVGCPFLRLQ